MSAYHRWGSHAHINKSRLPPTPPEYQTSYPAPLSAALEEAPMYYNSQQHQSRHSYSTRDYIDRYQPSNGYSSHGGHGRSKQVNTAVDYAMNFPQPLSVQYAYPPAATTILPPIQVPDEMDYQYHQPHVDFKQKEEKPTGGVAQHLDYEMDMMASFVAEMCQQMVSRVSSSPTSQFRKYVTQILSSTRLPSSTIMLGLFYLQERMKFEKGDLSSSGSLMRMLTTCLLLGSKFLDDNTFQNRSWAEVSNIPVQELNSMELQWLKDFNWEIHSLMYDPDQGFYMWVDHWHAYEEKAQVAQAKSSQKLAPINTSISRHSYVQQPLMSPEGPIPPQYQQGTQYDATWPRPRLSEYSPPSTHHSGPSTPEYYGNNWAYSAVADAYTGRASWKAPTKGGYAPRPQIPSYYSHPYSQGYPYINAWSPHGSHCNCSLCNKQSADFYASHAGYHVQPVVG